MISRSPAPASIEALEKRIAPAVVFPAVQYHLPNIDAGAGQTGAVVDLSKLFDSNGDGPDGVRPNHTLVTFHTNFDADPLTPGIQGDITIELFDDLAPLTVQNFIRYALNTDENGNYDGTFFHRLVGGFVLQGGGFQLDGKNAEHIETFDEVHNEFDRVLRSNVRGTVALAKTGLGPNTGSSEWFINLADNNDPNNPDSLDNQNGGFTVFGRVIDMPGVVDGMEVVDKIAALPTATGIVGDSPTPIQNYTPGKPFKVNSDNLITVKDVTVKPSSGGNSKDITYEFVGATNLANGQPSDLLTGSITGAQGNQLNLSYVPGKSGVAEVTIRATKDGQSVEETFQVTVLPNLITHIQSDGFNPTIIPGQTANVVLDIANTGGATYQGDVEVKFFLAEYKKVSGSNGSYSYQLITPYDRTELGSVTESLNLTTGSSFSLTKSLQIPTDIFADSGTVFQVFAEIVPKSGTEHFTDDNFALEGRKHQLYNQFGTYNTADAGPVKNAVLTYTEADGDVVTFSIKGPGVGKLVKAADGSIDIELSGTTAKTKVFAHVDQSATGDGNFVLRNLDAKSTLGTAQFGQVDVRGGLAFPNGVKVVQLDDILGPSTISIGEFVGAKGAKATLSFGSIHDLRIDSIMPIASLTATEWLDTTGEHDALNATSLKILNITGKAGVLGDLQADVSITTSAQVNALRVAGLLKDSTTHINGKVGLVSLGGIENSSFGASGAVNTFSVAGLVKDSTFHFDGKLGSISSAGFENSDLLATSTVKTFHSAGLLKDSTVQIYGNVGSVSLDGIVDSSFLVGTDKRPDTTADFIVERTVGSFKISTDGVFANSTVAAARFNNIVLHGIDGDSSTTEFGIVAEAIKSYNGDGHKLSAPKPGIYQVIGKYQVEIVTEPEPAPVS